MSPLDLNALPDPPGSPLEKLLPDTMWENIEPRIRDTLSENPTKDEILRAFSYYDRVLADYIQRHEQAMTYWANIHTHAQVIEGGWTAAAVTHTYSLGAGYLLRKFTPLGVLEWTADLSVGSPGNFYSLGIDELGNTYQFSMNLVRKIDSDGNIVWTNSTLGITYAGFVSPDGQQIVVGSESSISFDLARLDPSDGSIEWSRTLDSWVWSVTLDREGNIYCGCGDGATRKVSPDGTLLLTYINANQTKRIGAIVHGPDGYIYASEYQDGGVSHINKIAPDLNTTIWTLDGGSNNIDSMALSADGYLFVATRNQQVRRIEPDGSAINPWGTNVSGRVVRAVAVDPNGDVHLAADSFSSPKGTYRLNADGTAAWYDGSYTASLVAADPGPIDAF